MPFDPSNPQLSPSPDRLQSLDALRGFDMLWIIGGDQVVRGVCAAIATPWADKIAQQFVHVEWEGFVFYDLIFPLFLFIIGVAIPYSVSGRRKRGDGAGRILLHALTRVCVMIFFGFMVNGKLLSWNPKEMHLSYSVLQMLALGYFVATCAYVLCSLRVQVVIWIALLVSYWAALTYIPLPSGVHRVGVYAQGATFGDWLNDFLLGDWQTMWRFGWILSISTHGATATAGCFAGQLLRSKLGEGSKVNWLIVAGALGLAAGWFWGFSFPIIKNRWTSSFVLFAGGWSCFLLAAFYLVVDIWKYRAWTFPLQVIGSNSIVAYLSGNVFYSVFVTPGVILFGDLVPALGTLGQPLLQLCRVLSIFGFLWLLRRANVYVRI